MATYYQRSQGIQPFNAGVGEAKATTATALANALSGFAARREEELIQRKAEQGSRAGFAEGVKAQDEGRSPEQKGGLLSKVLGPTAFDEAFNDVAEHTYLRASEMDMRTQLAKARIDAQGSVETFNTLSSDLKKGFLKGADTKYQAELSALFDQHSELNGVSVYSEQQQKQIQQALDVTTSDLSDLHESVMDAERAGDLKRSEAYQTQFMGRLQQAVDVGVIDAGKGKEMAQQFENELVRQTLLRNVREAHTAGEGEAYIQSLTANSEELASFFGDPGKLIGEATTELRRLNSVEAMAKAEGYAKTVAAWDVRQARGEVSQGDIQSAYDRGELEPSEYSVLMRRQINADEALVQTGMDVSRAQAAYEGQGLLDPFDKNDRKAMNAHFGVALSGQSEKPLEDQLKFGVDYAARVGMIPEKLQGMIRANLRSGTPEGRILAASMYGRMMEENPELRKEMPDREVDLAIAINENNRLGMAPEEAIEMAMESLNVEASVREDRKTNFSRLVREKEIRTDKMLDEVLDDAFDPGIFGSAPKATAPILADYEKVLQGAYERHGNLEAAEAYAKQKITTMWGPSRVNGDRTKKVVKYPAEQWYGQPGVSEKENADWIRAQALSEAKAQGHDIKAEQLNLMPHPVYPVGNDGRPNYMVYWFGDDGVRYRVNNGRDEPAVWRPDFKSSPASGRLAEQRKQNIEEARAKKEERIKNGGTLLMPEFKAL